MTYKYYLAITSQLSFCSVPLRMDTYSSCQFSCSYCFSKSRGGAAASREKQEINPEALRKRLVRAKSGNGCGAVEEFLARQVPVQLGGMNDPFSPWEKVRKRTYETLRVLSDFDYPTIISTKGTLIAEQKYLDVLSSGNFYVRVSASLAGGVVVQKLERGVPTFEERLAVIAKLAKLGIPVSLRLQPIVPGEEEHMAAVVRAASNVGTCHISAEYLKLPLERRSTQAICLQEALPDIYRRYRDAKARRIGREFVLPSARKKDGLFELQKETRSAGMSYGFADNEFLHLNRFESCCNGADLYLRNARFFGANILGIIKRQVHSNKILFRVEEDEWIPSSSVFSHLNSRSRGNKTALAPAARYVDFLRSKWNSSQWRGGPSSFWGIGDSGEVDGAGNKIFFRQTLELD